MKKTEYLFGPYSIKLLLLAIITATALTCWLGIRQITYFRIDVSSPNLCVIQLYYDTGKGFNEHDSQKIKIKGLDTFLTHRIELPRKHIKALRLDFSADTSRIGFANISLTDRRNQVLEKIDIRQLTAMHDIASTSYKNGTVAVTRHGLDPQLHVPSPPLLPWKLDFRLPFFLSMIFILYLLFFSLKFFLVQIPRKKGITTNSATRLSRHNFLASLLHNVLLAGGALLLFAGLLCFFRERQNKYIEPSSEALQYVLFQHKVSGRGVSFKRPDGVRLEGTLYNDHAIAGGKKAILLLHGHYPEGDRFPLYVVLAEELAARGYIVLTISFSEYGDSGDPFRLGKPEAINMDIDTETAISFLLKSSGVDPEHIMIVGHSMGADSALSVGVRNNAIKAIALIGPPRRVFDQFETSMSNHFWRQTVLIRKRKYGEESFPGWYCMEIWKQQNIKRDMVHYLSHLNSWSHKPILLLDGAREKHEDRFFLKWYAGSISHPKKQITLLEADHTCNVSLYDGKIIYVPKIMEQAVNALDQWFRTYAGGKPLLMDRIDNLLRWIFAVDLFA